MIDKLPSGKPVIGFREVARGFKSGKIKQVVVAKNCPKKIISHFPEDMVQVFDGDQKQLGTRLGKPFFVAVIGFEEVSEK
ncbi:MAG: ribosomal L7Ae/L30e/S12e/Gadd45 family protein [Candidatus Aenigmarchaeota archaeon]|nr:ribosomal L7Ae/L30e/S12e/Gadd45 family protein [Candidatus Aenigmarchaeota archaeon]